MTLVSGKLRRRSFLKSRAERGIAIPFKNSRATLVESPLLIGHRTETPYQPKDLRDDRDPSLRSGFQKKLRSEFQNLLLHAFLPQHLRSFLLLAFYGPAERRRVELLVAQREVGAV